MGWGRTAPDLRGRHDDLDAVRAAIDAARSGEGRIIVLEGEAGIGKSRLLDEAVALAEDAEFAVARGGAEPLELGRPFGTLVDAFRLSRSSDDPDRAALAEHLFAEVVGSHAHATAPDVQYLVQEGLIELVERMVAERPVLLALDDLQWADRATLAATVALARRTAELPLVVLAAIRPAPRSVELDQALGRLGDLGGVLVDLAPLPSEDVLALAEELLGTAPEAELVDQLEKCRGNPFFVIETVQAPSADPGGSNGSRSLPSTLRSSLLRRAAGLSGPAQEALRMAAILGTTFAVEDLAALLRRPVAVAADASREACRAGLLEESEGSLVFRHDLIREALYEEMPAPARSALHRDAATVLADRAPTHVVAQHLALGAEAGDAEAVDWLRRAATEVAPRDPATAVDLLERAIDLQPADDTIRRELRTEHIEGLTWAGRLAEAEAEAKQALSEDLDPDDEAELRIELGRCRVLQGNTVGAIRQLQLAAMHHGLDDRVRAWITADCATARFVSYDLATTRREAEEAMEWGERLGDKALRVAGCGIAARVAAIHGRFADAFALGKEAVTVARDDPEALRRLPHLYLGIVLFDGDRPVEAITAIRQGIQRSEELGAAWALPRMHNALVSACFFAGAWDDALVEADVGASLASDVGSRSWFPQAQSIAGLIAFHRGDVEGARNAAARALADLDQPGADAGGYGWLNFLQALLAEDAGEPLEPAVQGLTDSFEICKLLGIFTMMPRLAFDLVRLSLVAGDRDRAEDTVAWSEKAASVSGTPTSLGAAALCRGYLEGDADQVLAATGHYRDVRPLDFIRSARAAADLLEVAGRRDEAVPVLEEALGWCRKLEADRHGQAISGTLETWRPVRAASVPYRDRPKTGWESLTPAERSVATLVGESCTNAEIAAQLFISRRTVENHMNRIYRKLQIKGRVALAMEAAAHS